MTHAHRRLLLIGIGAYFLFLIGGIPAQKAFSWIAPADDSVRVQRFSGTIWAGRARLVQYRAAHFDQVKWRLRPLALLLGRLEFNIRIDDRDVGLTARVGRDFMGRTHIGDGHGTISAARLDTLVSVMPVAFSGSIQVEIEDGLFDDDNRWLEGTLRWQQAGVSSQSVVVPFGDLSLVLEPADQGMTGLLRDETPQGPFAVDAELRVPVDGAWSLVGSLKPRGTIQPEVETVLGFIGEPSASGGYRVDLKGQL